LIGKKILEGINLTIMQQQEDKLSYPLREANIYVREREIAVIEGHRKSGKSTILQTIAGEHELKSGVITVKNIGLSSLRNEQERKNWKLRIAYHIPDIYELIDDASVQFNIELPLMLLDYSPRLRYRQMILACEAFKILDLRKTKASELTPGQVFSVLCAQALVADPAIIMLDDPFTNLPKYFKIDSMRDTMEELNFCIHVFRELNRTLLITAREHSRYIYRNRLFRKLFGKLILT